MSGEEALARFERASTAIRQATAGKLDGVEQEYGLSYQALVRLGLRQQIKRKYRVR